MFALKLVTLLVAATAAVAYPSGLISRDGDVCSTGTITCCNTIQPASSINSALLAGVLPTNLQGTNIPMGLTCSPMSVLSEGGFAGQCASQVACCSSVQANIGVNCSPLAI